MQHVRFFVVFPCLYICSELSPAAAVVFVLFFSEHENEFFAFIF